MLVLSIGEKKELTLKSIARPSYFQRNNHFCGGIYPNVSFGLVSDFLCTVVYTDFTIIPTALRRNILRS
jgi:hypothetical protein